MIAFAILGVFEVLEKEVAFIKQLMVEIVGKNLKMDYQQGYAISGMLVGRFLLDGSSNSIATYSLTSELVNNDLYRISGDSLITATDFSYNQSMDHLVQIKTSVLDT